MAAVSPPVLNVGDIFATYTDVKNAVSMYENQQFANYYVSDSRKIEAAKKTTPKVAAKAVA